MIRDINQHPSKTLNLKAFKIEQATETLTSPRDHVWPNEIIDLGTDLLNTAASIQDICLGLASNQIWDKDTPAPSMFVMRWPGVPIETWGWKIILNPVVKGSGKKEKSKEGCLSLHHPKSTIGNPKRRANAEMTYQTLDSEEVKTIKFYGHLGPYAKIVQHEYDHLQGKLCIEN
ncbi:peptide deformylase [bacterium]|nr:peptide deformylase [bacterium]